MNACAGAGEGSGARHAPASFPDAEILSLFDGLDSYATLALAVSGGGDSMGLLHLIHRWRRLARRAGKPVAHPPLVLTVDHGLRPQSAGEAALVADECFWLEFTHETLAWTGPKPATGLQAAARDARYRLMADRLTGAAAPVALLTAHTRDDQAETVLMRLARGSGVEGLGGIERVRTLTETPRIDLVRPLLDVEGERLRAMLSEAGRPWIEDPTNANLDHERPRIRAARPALLAIGLADAPLARTASRLARADHAISWATRRLASELLMELPGLFARIDAEGFYAAPAELRVRLLAAVLARYGGSHPRATLSEVERLEQACQSTGTAATLGGCEIRRDTRTIDIAREVGRLGLPEAIVAPGEALLWDNRFKVSAPAAASAAVNVRAIGLDTWRAPSWSEVRERLRDLPDRVAATAPAGLFVPSGYEVQGLKAFSSADSRPFHAGA